MLHRDSVSVRFRGPLQYFALSVNLRVVAERNHALNKRLMRKGWHFRTQCARAAIACGTGVWVIDRTDNVALFNGMRIL